MMQADVRELDLDYLLKCRNLAESRILIDHDIDQIKRLIQHLQAIGGDPQRQIIRFIDKPWHAYVYHDIPIFASIVYPSDPIAAVEVIRKLDRATPFSSALGDEHSGEKSIDLDPLQSDFVQSLPMRHAAEQLRKLAKLSVDTIMLGETGVGKDTCAHWLHEHSDAKGEFIHVNCAALPDELFEAELFGVMAGAFTGALKDRPGKLELAHQGTLYLDEIDSMSLGCQAKLLNALQYRGATRLGAAKPYHSEFRVIASTKVKFEALIRNGKFREDLYFRLNISKVYIPALRERLEDLVPLYSFFLKMAARQFKLPVPQINPDEIAHVLSQSWRGNVRELKAFAQRRVIGLDLMDLHIQSGAVGLKEQLNQFERTVLEQTLRQCNGCVREASLALKIPLHSLYYRLKRLGMSLDEQDDQKVMKEHRFVSRNSSSFFDT
ncbi:sigma 54-interacting transcriptional regulator [Limnobacter sp.]|uniref:sigma 54-interacting transcriptional regulator n=1 Tax=Limnobacter sp. TaxID=2003368 RepID=UPI002E311FF4|nr:sigma 54-interacting transcriptional regulator [Limnobacter sp.]